MLTVQPWTFAHFHYRTILLLQNSTLKLDFYSLQEAYNNYFFLTVKIRTPLRIYILSESTKTPPLKEVAGGDKNTFIFSRIKLENIKNLNDLNFLVSRNKSNLLMLDSLSDDYHHERRE